MYSRPPSSRANGDSGIDTPPQQQGPASSHRPIPSFSSAATLMASGSSTPAQSAPPSRAASVPPLQTSASIQAAGRRRQMVAWVSGCDPYLYVERADPCPPPQHPRLGPHRRRTSSRDGHPSTHHAQQSHDWSLLPRHRSSPTSSSPPECHIIVNLGRRPTRRRSSRFPRRARRDNERSRDASIRRAFRVERRSGEWDCDAEEWEWEGEAALEGGNDGQLGRGRAERVR